MAVDMATRRDSSSTTLPAFSGCVRMCSQASGCRASAAVPSDIVLVVVSWPAISTMSQVPNISSSASWSPASLP